MFSSLAPERAAAATAAAAAASKNVDESGPASPERLCHMHADVADMLRANTTPRRRRARRPLPAAAQQEPRGRARYGYAFEEEPPAEDDYGFAPPRMVWAKVKGYPRWPGQVFDPADASALALRERRANGAALVACFGDGSFVWAAAADLTPLRDDFPRLAGVGLRSNCKVEFALALDGALAEVARRVDAGLSCGCFGAAAKRQVFHNSGLRRGASGAAVDAGFARDVLRGEEFLGYVGALAVAPGDGADRLDHAVAAAQLEAFNRWRGKNVLVLAECASRAATPKRTARARGQDDGVLNGGMLSPATPRTRRATTPKRTRPAGKDDGVAGSAMVFSASRTTTPKTTRPRGQDGGDASTGNRVMTRCARAAAADAAYMRNVFRGDASVDYYASAKGLTLEAGAELALATAQPRSFAQWTAASPTFAPDEHAGTHDDDTTEAAKAAMDAAAKMMTRPTVGEDSGGDPGKWRMTSCISSREENSGCEDGDDATGSGCSSEAEAPSHETTVSSGRWKNYLIVLQFMAIVVLLCRLTME